MQQETNIAKDIVITSDKAKYDAACKRLLANKVILAWIMRECLEEYKEYSIEEIQTFIQATPHISTVGVDTDTTNSTIIGMRNEDRTLTEGTIYYDVYFYAIVPKGDSHIKIILNVEAQNEYDPKYPLTKRGIYYGSRMISAQKGVEFENSDYSKIKKVYSLWICMEVPEQIKNTITEYNITEKNIVGTVKREKSEYDLMTVIMLCLGKEENGNYDGIIKLLSVLLSSTYKPEEKKQILQDEFAIEMTKTIEGEVNEMCNLSDGVEKRGIEIGRLEGKLETLRNLMKTTGWELQKAMEMLGLDKEEQEKYRELLEQ